MHIDYDSELIQKINNHGANDKIKLFTLLFKPSPQKKKKKKMFTVIKHMRVCVYIYHMKQYHIIKGKHMLITLSIQAN